MNGEPEPGAVLYWRGSHDVLGTEGPVVLTEPTADPEFWVVAPLDQDGVPTSLTFAVPVAELVPHLGWRRPRLPAGAAKQGMLRVAAVVAAAASFALGSLTLIGHQRVTPLAEGTRPVQVSRPSNTSDPSISNTDPARGGRALASEQRTGAERGASVLFVAAPTGGESGTGGTGSEDVAPSDRDAVGDEGGGGTGTGGSTGGGSSGGGGSSDGGGSNDGGGSDGGLPGGVIPVDARPGNSGSAPGHDSTPGNSGSARGHDKAP